MVRLQFHLDELPEYEARYNIAPTASVLVVKRNGAAMVRWGLVPHWAKDPSMGARMNNARAETVRDKPAFRDAYRARRCLIPMNGFYEWKEGKAPKQPYYFRPAEGPLLAIAGIWERWRDLETCAVITTDANGVMAPVHERMPVVLAPHDYEGWLNGEENPLAPCPDSMLIAQPVSKAVNNARTESALLVEPVDADA